MEIIWTHKAVAQLEKVIDYIQQDSPMGAQKIYLIIVELVEKAAQQPERFPVDKYKENNDGSWRAFEKYHYRVSYRITQTAIHIVRIRHTSQSPLQY
jgi:plasmid stabilization system protein ParE